jgi:dihydropteroate synthase
VIVRLGGRAIEATPRRPLVMGIVNASPDSFSERGGARGLDAQVRRAHELLEAGAGLIDVGGESGRTDRPPVPAAEEAERVVPLVERLVREGALVSVDTWKLEVAEAALAAGAAMVNDVSGLRDPAIADACARAGAALVVVHTRAEPKTKAFPAYDDVLVDVRAFLAERLALAERRGVARDALVVDPGPDLAKTPAETVRVLRDLAVLRGLGRPVLLAASRKDFVGAVTGRRPSARLAGTLAAIEAGLAGGAAILRVHDVRETVDYLAVRAVLRGDVELDPETALAEELRREDAA